MQNRLKLRKAATAAVAMSASALLLAGCGSNEGSSNGGDAKSGSSAAASDKSNADVEQLKKMLLTNEVEGFDFKGDLSSPEFGPYANSATESTTVEPQECQKVFDFSKQISDFTMSLAENKSENVFATTGMYSNADMYDTMVKGMEGCSTFTVKTDGAQSARKILEEQGASPEIIAELEKTNASTTTKMTVTKLDLPIAEDTDKYFAVEQSGTAEAAGTGYVVDEFRIVGVVDGLVVVASTQPYANFGVDSNGKVVGQADGGEITPEAKETAKKRAVEIFNAQVKKIKNA